MATTERTMGDILGDLSKSYTQWKDGEKGKEKARKEFFAAATVELSNTLLAEKYATVRADSEEEARDRLLKQNPGWEVEAIRRADSEWEAILVEDPSVKEYTITYDGKVYTRQIVSGSPMLDDERLIAENPELYGKVTEVPYRDFLENLMYHCGVDGNDVKSELDNYLAILPGAPERALRPLEDLGDEELAAIQDYIYYGKPTIKLAAPKEAKSE